MSPKLLASCGTFPVRLYAFDVFWAAISPLLALSIRDALIIPYDGILVALLYCDLSFAFTLIAFLVFRVSHVIPRYFSVDDTFNILKAAIAAVLTTSVFLFTLTRLAGIPRSIPILQVLILAAGLVAARSVMMLFDKDAKDASVAHPDLHEVENIIMIGATRLSSLFIKMLRAQSPVHCHVIAVLDDDQEKIGRAIRGIPVIAPPRQLDSVIEEFAVHGVPIDRVILGGDEQLLSREMLNHVLRICGQREVVLDYVPRLISLSPLRRTSRHNVPLISLRAQQELPTAFSRYFRFKRVTDFIAAFAAIIVLSPLFIVASAVILFDLGSPVLFWQQRFGQNGRHFLLYKFRTLRPPFDRHGQPIGEDQRISRIGRFLRQIRFDELPQLFNVLVGDMSLIGPRPLLLIDQPKKLNVRLAVRPGMTGWAQVNGGNLVTAEEKGALDEWYVRNASLWLDLRIALLTLRFLFTGERRSEAAVTEANASQEMRPLRASAEGRRLAASD